MSHSDFKPYIPPELHPREFTFRAVALGAILGIVFAASSVYLALKVGMTVSASIPVAVLSITLFRLFGKATILENNIVQTTGSAGESIAFGVATTMPVFLLLGMEMQLLPILTMSLLGGILGVLMMIPLRQGLIVKEHGKLTYPEGTACADVLIVGEKGGTTAKTVFMGFGIGALYKLLCSGFRLWSEIPSRMLGFFKGASVAAEISPELLGVGYIIGSKVSANMMAGGTLAFLILIPAIKIFGENLDKVIFPATTLIRDMTPSDVRNAYILYIGAGAVATGGIISLIRSFPTIISAFRRGFRTFLQSRKGGVTAEKTLRTDQDLPLWVVVFGSIGLVAAIWLSPILGYQCHLRHPDCAVRVFLCDCIEPDHRRNRILIQPDIGNDRRHSLNNLPSLPCRGLDRSIFSGDGSLHGRDRLHCGVQRRDNQPGLENRIPCWSDPKISADCDHYRRRFQRPGYWLDSNCTKQRSYNRCHKALSRLRRHSARRCPHYEGTRWKRLPGSVCSGANRKRYGR